MGKKAVIKENVSETLKEQEKIETNIKKSGGAAQSKKLESSKFYIASSYNNTLITVTDDKGNVLAWSSAGNLGFKGPRKATPYAATSIVDGLLQKLKKFDLGKVSIFVKGVGGGREAAVRALINNNLNIQVIRDVTPIAHNGPRKKKARRV
ncbi:MAG: SSU ribosomal protein S11P [Parcubacteria group bacterium GW2011_GWC1_45_9]|nr:MAG: SSU ribosomal protein S11P [Parcubacteria group bacterium GW2011_GWA1_Parcubacteria_45_10]KKT89301.1 MAG: SSU ribosomal protein S11P [Parcubacteria group bacterium GW2011_GWB1_45_10]KKU17117.1 MAG: SSU ribosomal protein S11P [Parcubacteria group bacterium GW2011_GWC1_45_9]HCI05513.1 30S ribosomal protein S11 [Patescibacteria group bacterium]